MAFHDILLNPKFSYGATGGISYSTLVLQSVAGYEQRNINWSQVLGEWDISYSIRDDSDIEDLIAFYAARYGRGHTFRFLDWKDYTITNENIGTGSSTPGTKWQLTKTYTDAGGNTYERNITKPVDTSDTNHTLSLSDPSYTTFTLKAGGITKAETTDYTVDYSTGIVTDVSGLSGAIVVSCSFHNHCRFDVDLMEVVAEYYQLGGWENVKIKGVKAAA